MGSHLDHLSAIQFSGNIFCGRILGFLSLCTDFLFETHAMLNAFHHLT